MEEAILDYVTFVRYGDEKMLYDTHNPEFTSAVNVVEAYGPPDDRWYSVQPNMKRGYTIFTAWGSDVGHLIANLPIHWLGVITRLDLRQRILGLGNDEWKAICLAMNVMAPSKLQSAHLKSRPAKKTDRRDTGGHGMRYGSRKSDRSVIYYRRGTTAPCIEFRLQNKAAYAVVSSVNQLRDLGNTEPIHHLIIGEMMVQRERWFLATLGTTPEQHLSAMRGISPQVQEAFYQASMFIETSQERAAWEVLSTEEQEDIQQATWDITPKGAPELTRNKPPHLLDYGESEPLAEEDLPF